MHRITLFSTIILLLIFFDACQYPVENTELPNAERFIIIDAELTEMYGKVAVNYSLTDVNSRGGYLFPDPPSASAYVLDSKGNRTDFLTDGTINEAFRGVVGETYKLYVIADGQMYESTEETMRACPELDSLTPVYTRESNRNPNDLFYDGFDVYAQLSDTPGEENFYQWDWIHYARLGHCDRVLEGDQYVYVPCFPVDCWSIGYNTKVIVQSDKLRDGNTIAHRIVRVPFSYPPSKYYLRVEQRAVTPTVFTYLQSLETQNQNTGSLFDVPAQTRFSPNIYNVENPKERIIGVFSVYSSRTKHVIIDMRQEIPGATPKARPDYTPFSLDPFAIAPCTETLYRTQQKPEGWID